VGEASTQIESGVIDASKCTAHCTLHTANPHALDSPAFTNTTTLVLFSLKCPFGRSLSQSKQISKEKKIK